jgi:small subunit ribosomal protein S16
VAVKIRLMRVGKKKQPTYRVVVADARSPRDGRIIETIGQYGPRHEPSLIQIDDERALDWLRKGAQPTEQVQKLLAVTGVWATFETEKGKPAVTRLSRRAYATGRGPATTKKSKKQLEAEAAAPPPAAAPAPAAEAEPVEPPAAEVEAAPEAVVPEEVVPEEVVEAPAEAVADEAPEAAAEEAPADAPADAEEGSE